MVRRDAEIHGWWEIDGDPTDRLEAMVDLREHVADLLPTAQTFQLTDVSGEWHYTKVTEEMIRMTGAWPLPDVFAQGNQSSQRWVNPNYGHRHRMPESYAECECGTILSRGYHDGGNSFETEHDHTDDCGVPERLRARARMLEMRREALVRGLRLGHSGRQLAPQIGVRAKGVGEIARSLGISLDDEKEIYRRRSGRTYAEFCSRGYDPHLIADAYDVHHATLQRRANAYTEAEYDHSSKEWIVPWYSEDGRTTEHDGSQKP